MYVEPQTSSPSRGGPAWVGDASRQARVRAVMAHLPLSTFRRCVARYDGEHKVKSFSCLDKFYAMAFAQLTFRESPPRYRACLATQAHRLYRLGSRSPVARNKLVNANAVRPWQIYVDLAQHQNFGIRSALTGQKLREIGCFWNSGQAQSRMDARLIPRPVTPGSRVRAPSVRSARSLAADMRLSAAQAFFATPPPRYAARTASFDHSSAGLPETTR
jgi:hypothetical protein